MKSDSQHTFMIGAIRENGVWALDSNYGPGVDKTPRYHFFTWDKLNEISGLFTIYRIEK